ncbi:MAG: YfdX family protein [Sphingopyxis terrae]|nr:YfdX family protein [Sphingopyxis terrae]
MPIFLSRRPSPVVSAPVRRHRLGMLALGAGLLLTSCERDAKQPDQAADSETVTAPADRASASKPAASALSGDLGGQLAAKRKTLVAEAVSALQETHAALDLLSGDESRGAVEALARATGKLDIVLAADPHLALAPVDVGVATHDVVTTPEAVIALRTRAEEALDDGRLQDGRHLIADLASEQVISVTSLPLSTYPAAIKQAAALIHDGNPAAAAAMLETALSTLVVEETVIPLPLARAEALLSNAQPLSEKPQRSADEQGQLQRLLAGARTQLDLARTLGYATKRDLDALYNALKAIEDKAEAKEGGKGLFDRLGELFGTANRSSNASQKHKEG